MGETELDRRMHELKRTSEEEETEEKRDGGRTERCYMSGGM